MGKTKFVCFLIFLAACVLWFPVSGQSVVVDSLERVVEGSGTPNGARIEAMERLSKILGAQNKFEDAFAMLEQAQQLKIGRASCRERVCKSCRFRWSPLH